METFKDILSANIFTDVQIIRKNFKQFSQKQKTILLFKIILLLLFLFGIIYSFFIEKEIDIKIINNSAGIILIILWILIVKVLTHMIASLFKK